MRALFAPGGGKKHHIHKLGRSITHFVVRLGCHATTHFKVRLYYMPVVFDEKCIKFR